VLAWPAGAASSGAEPAGSAPEPRVVALRDLLTAPFALPDASP
jgi:hypothetical protein